MATGIARSRLSDLHLAEDAAQEAFAIACRSLTALQDHKQFPHWLGTICRRTASKMANSRTTHEQLSEDVEMTSDGRAESSGEEIHIALMQLDETAREIVVLHYFSELSYEEIACVMGLSTQAIHGRLQRARRKLATRLKTDGVKQ